jgi:hypothetical protein
MQHPVAVFVATPKLKFFSFLESLKEQTRGFSDKEKLS